MAPKDNNDDDNYNNERGNDAKTIHSKKRNIHDMIQEYSNEIINDALNSSALELAVQKNQYQHDNKKLKIENDNMKKDLTTLHDGLNDIIVRLKIKYNERSDIINIISRIYIWFHLCDSRNNKLCQKEKKETKFAPQE